MESFAKSNSCNFTYFSTKEGVRSSTFTNFPSSKEALQQLTLLYRLIASADHCLFRAMFYCYAARGPHKHFFGNFDVAVMNVDVVEISASSKKRTIHGGVVVWCG